jgi:amino-acid N-acetyltransferase
MTPVPALADDYEPIKALLMECDLPTQDLTLEHLRHFLILQNEGNLVGVVGLEVRAQFGLLRSLAVQEKLRGQGLGQQLVSHAENHAATNFIQMLYLLTTTADLFFASLRYTETNRQQVPAIIQSTSEFATICPSSAVCMVKQIQQIKPSVLPTL